MQPVLLEAGRCSTSCATRERGSMHNQRLKEYNGCAESFVLYKELREDGSVAVINTALIDGKLYQWSDVLADDLSMAQFNKCSIAAFDRAKAGLAMATARQGGESKD